MDEPLLGSLKRPSSLIIHNLSRIPESNETTDHIGIPRTPSSIKEKLIFGSPDLSPTSSVAHRQDSLLADDICYEAADAQVPYNDNTCVCGRSFNESGREREREERENEKRERVVGIAAREMSVMFAVGSCLLNFDVSKTYL
ncbi:hypothetical protein KP509_1Z226600 [Ceratopteris richardii]|nr:hypothetical protein KP509_1Z226600 [Ceratopteris richardii]